MKHPVRSISRWLLGAFFIIAGLNHFRMPEVYVSMMPPYLPAPHLLNSLSGIAEILGGIGVLMQPVRKMAAWGLIALLVAVFPANLHVALHGWPGMNLAPWVLWARLPFQVLFILWVYFTLLHKPQPS